MKLAFSLNDLSYRAACEGERYVKSLTQARKQALVARDPKMRLLVGERIVR